MDNPEVATAFLNVVVASLTQLGIPAVFLFAWFQERKRNDDLVKNYIRDLRRAGGLTRPEDVLMADPAVVTGGGGSWDERIT